ncbi:MAG: septum formation initiator family protein [Ruminococcus sp.]|nr:septum formation initiator family protein [Ruminococcus sp.]
MAENNGVQTVYERPKKRLGHVIGAIAVFCLIVYSVFNIISQQAQIAQLKKQSEELAAQITEQEQRNDEYTRLLSSGDEAEYMERIAVEQLGYAYPNERRFYIVEGGSTEQGN